MKTKSICIAALCTISLSAMAQSSVSLSGTADLGARHVQNGSLGSVSSLVSGANSTTRLVLQANKDFGDGLSGTILLDGTVFADTGVAGSNAPAGQVWDRRATLGLADVRRGELRLGRDWVPTHLVWSGFDPFSTLGIAGANTFRSFAASRALGQAFGTTVESQAANSTLRVSNVVEYLLPAGLAGVYGSLHVSAGEAGTTANGFTRGNGVRIGWAGGNVNVAAAQFSTRNTTGDTSFRDQTYGASYDFGVAKLNIARRIWTYGADRTVNTQIGAAIPFGPGVIKLTLVQADQTGATAAQSANDASLLGAGYVYNLAKGAFIYGHVARLDNKGTAIFAIPGGPAVSATTTASNYFGGKTSTAYELGIRYDF